MFLKLKIKAIIGLVMFVLLFGGGMYTMYVLGKSDDKAVASKEIKDAKVTYKNMVLESFKEQSKLLLYSGDLSFESTLKSDATNSAVGDFFFGKETTVYVKGNLEVGINTPDIEVDETDKNLILRISESKFVREFKADKKASGVKSESGVFALDYDAETVSRFWGEIEETAATTEVSDKDWENIKETVKTGLAQFVLGVMPSESKKTVVVEIIE